MPALAAAGAREELVPGGEARALAVGDHLELPSRARGRAPIEVRIHEVREPHVAHDLDGLGVRGRLLDPSRVGRQRVTMVAGARAPRGVADQRHALRQLAGHVLAGLHALGEIGLPGAERIGERLDRVDPPRIVRQRERARPAVIVHEPHRRLAPRALVGATVEEERHQYLVALLEDVGADLEHGADLALDRIAAAVDVRRDRLDHHGAAQIGGGRQVAPRPGRLAHRGGRAGFLPDGKPGLARGRHG